MAGLSEKVNEFQHKLRRGEYVSEAAVSQGVVLPALHELGWPVFDTSIVAPEYSLGDRGERRVDYALCHPANRPAVFIEVKKDLRNTQGGDRQLFEYAFHAGVPMTILTDGQEWSFYLPAEQGHYDERRVYKLDLLERGAQDAVSILDRYLQYGGVCSGKALESARQDYKNEARKREIQETIPKAWASLLQESDTLLIELLSEKVEDLCGYQPDPELCGDFLENQAAHSSEYPPTQPKAKRKAATTPQQQPQEQSTVLQTRRTRKTGTFRFVFRGRTYTASTATDAMVQIFRLLAKEDDTFLERFCARKHGRTRRYIARDRYELYPERRDLAENHAVELLDEWWMGTNYSRRTMEVIIRLGCDVAGLTYGSEVQIELS